MKVIRLILEAGIFLASLAPCCDGHSLRNCPCNQPTSAGSQNFSERIIDFVFLSERDDSILVHGVTLLVWGRQCQA